MFTHFIFSKMQLPTPHQLTNNPTTPNGSQCSTTKNGVTMDSCLKMCDLGEILKGCRLCEIVIFIDIFAQMFTLFLEKGKQEGKHFGQLLSITYLLPRIGR